MVDFVVFAAGFEYRCVFFYDLVSSLKIVHRDLLPPRHPLVYLLLPVLPVAPVLMRELFPWQWRVDAQAVAPVAPLMAVAPVAPLMVARCAAHGSRARCYRSWQWRPLRRSWQWRPLPAQHPVAPPLAAVFAPPLMAPVAPLFEHRSWQWRPLHRSWQWRPLHRSWQWLSLHRSWRRRRCPAWQWRRCHRSWQSRHVAPLMACGARCTTWQSRPFLNPLHQLQSHLIAVAPVAPLMAVAVLLMSLSSSSCTTTSSALVTGTFISTGCIFLLRRNVLVALV